MKVCTYNKLTWIIWENIVIISVIIFFLLFTTYLSFVLENTFHSRYFLMQQTMSLFHSHCFYLWLVSTTFTPEAFFLSLSLANILFKSTGCFPKKARLIMKQTKKEGVKSVKRACKMKKKIMMEIEKHWLVLYRNLYVNYVCNELSFFHHIIRNKPLH